MGTFSYPENSSAAEVVAGKNQGQDKEHGPYALCWTLMLINLVWQQLSKDSGGDGPFPGFPPKVLHTLEKWVPSVCEAFVILIELLPLTMNLALSDR